MKFIARTVFATILFFVQSASAQVDSVFHQRDSVITMDTAVSVGDLFSNGEKLPSPGGTTVVTENKKSLPLTSYLAKLGPFADHMLKDLDQDGKKELLIYNFTGGAHCCDEFYFYKNIGPNRYQFVKRLFAGNSFIGDSNKIYYDLSEQFGYFFTCYACYLEDTSDEAPLRVSDIVVRYNKGVVSIARGDQELRSKINDNLAKLGEQKNHPVDEDKMDDGFRKEFALNLAVYYFSFGKNLAETQRLFNKYYKFPDRQQVWTRFVSNLSSMKKDSGL